MLDARVPPVLAKTIVDEAVLVYGDTEEARRDLLRLYKLYLTTRRGKPLTRRGGRRRDPPLGENSGETSLLRGTAYLLAAALEATAAELLNQQHGGNKRAKKRGN